LDKNELIHHTALTLVFEKIFFLFGLKQEEHTIPEEINAFAEAREKARNEKDFAESDRLRDLIIERGYKVEDIPGSYRVKKL